MPEENQRPALIHYIAAGVEFIATFGLMLAGGLLLDFRYGTTPGFTLLGGAVGFGIALYRLALTGREISRQAGKNRRES